MIEIPVTASENIKNYISYLLCVSEYSDPDSKVSIRKKSNGIIVHIEPNNLEYRQDIINNVLWFNQYLKIPIKYSSSLKISKLISFEIEMEEE